MASLFSHRIDVFYIGSPLEDGAAIIPQFGKFRLCHVACTRYDLIPHVFYEHYLAEKWSKEPTLILAISEHTRLSTVFRILCG